MNRVRLDRRVVWLSGCAVAAWAASATAQERPHPRDLALPASQFEMPDTSQYRMFLQNRLVAFVVPDPRVPLVSFTALVRGGTANDERPGAAEMLALMLATRGPCWMAPGTFRQTLQDMAAEFRVQMTPEFTQVTLNVAADDARAGLRIFSGILRETCIDQQGLGAFRAAVADEQSRPAAGDSATATFDGSMSTALSLFSEILYGDHPYRSEVTESQARDLEVRDVEEFHRDYFTPVNVTLAVAGDFDLREMVQFVDQRFADWENRRPPFFRSAPSIDAPDTRQTHYFRADALQAWIVIGHELPEIDPRDLPALHVMNYILGGGHFDTRLFRETRDERGLTNDASGYLEPNVRGPGTYTFRTSGRPEVVDQLIDLIVAEVRRMQTDTVTAEELRVAKAAFTNGVFPMRFENGHAMAMTFAEEWARFFTFEYLARYRDRIRDVNSRDVQRAAQRYLDPDRLQVVVLGPQSSS